jgi:long-subunit fatty acid transport protein
VGTQGGYVDFRDFLPQVPGQAAQNAAVAQQHLALLNQAEQAGVPMTEQLTQARTALTQGLQQLQQSQGQLATLSKYAEGVNLLCNQSSVGVAPIIGVDYKFGNFNFAAKYEFKTQIRMKNESTVNEASEIAAVNKFRDGEYVNEDAPALLAVGAQWTPAEGVRVNAGYHHFFDKDADWYNNTQSLLDYDTNEYLLGAEWDVNDRLTVSAGGQLTRYGLTDDYMNDMSFVVNSYSLGFGFNYKVSDVVTLKAAYFQTNYGTYDRTDYPPLSGMNDSFTRTNRVLGVGVDVNL